MLVVASAFRNSESYIDRYFEQIHELRKFGPLRLVVGEGDSIDDTLWRLEQELDETSDLLLRVDHGGPDYGSVNKVERWAQIAYVWNRILDHVQMDDEDVFLLIESDLTWSAEPIARLAEWAKPRGAIAAMSMHIPTGNFYDIWGHRGLDGKRFTMKPPYHESLRCIDNPSCVRSIVPIASAGSAIAVRGDIINAGVRFNNEAGIRGFCEDIRRHTDLWLHTGIQVWHP